MMMISLKEAVAPVLVVWLGARADVALPKVLGNLGVSHSAGHGGRSLSQYSGNLPDVLQADEHTPNSFHYNHSSNSGWFLQRRFEKFICTNICGL